MAKKNFLIDLDLNNNQLLNATIQNLATAPATTGLVAGFIYWNTTVKTAYIYTGSASPNDWLDLGQIYVHPTGPGFNPSLTGANVLATLTVNTLGHVTAVSTRTLSLNDLGYTGAANANNYVHPTFTGNTLAGAPLTGAVVISNVTVSAEGHVTGFSVRSLAAADIGAAATNHTHTLATGATDVTATAAEVNILHLSGLTAGMVLKATGATSAAWSLLKTSELNNDLGFVSLNDSLTNLTQTWSSTKIQSAINIINGQITGALINKGGYNPVTNVPDITPAGGLGIKNGYTYVITANGTFYGTPVSIGDMGIANKDTPNGLTDWTVVNKNIPDIVNASIGNSGIIALAPTMDAGDNINAVTPSLILSYLNAGTGIGAYTITFGDGVATTFNITHGLATLNVLVEIIEVSTGQTVEMQVRRTSSAVVNIQCNTIPTTNQYSVLIKK